MASLSCLAAVFLAKGFPTPAASFVVSNSSLAAIRHRALHNLAFVPRHPQRKSQAVTAALSRTSLGRGHRLLVSALPKADPEIGQTDRNPKKVPITLLSGFLGSGKTTTLQHLLENKEGLKIGVIVNDVASVNIDAKLVKKSDSAGNRLTRPDGVIELHNGCACCSLADELLPTVETLLATTTTTTTANRQGGGGKSSFDAIVVELSGVGDPVAIQQHWKNSERRHHPITNKAEMKRVVTLVDASTFGTDWMTWDLAGERDGWIDPEDTCAASRKVPELLAEQIEAADVLLLNKIDLAGPKQVEVATALARSINEKAVLETVEFGKVASPTQIVRNDQPEAPKGASSESCCSNPNCPSKLQKTQEVDKEEEEEDESSHDHDHDHDHSHSHSHSHSHGTHTDNLGIVNFVYKADRPFETNTLMSLLYTWPIPIKADLEGSLEHFKPSSAKDDPELVGRDSPFFGVLRSKGFCWLAPTDWDAQFGDPWRHDTVMYWSHAGKHFGFETAGKWWATVEDKSKLKEHFASDPKEYERILAQDFVSEEWGDRRQEIVFIGANIDREKITKALDDCLLGDKAMNKYKAFVKQYQEQLKNYQNI